MTSFGKFIKTERERKGWSQTEFGALIKLNTPLVSRIENDKKNLTSDKIKLLAELFGMDYAIVKDLYFADKFAKEAYENHCTESVFAVAEANLKYIKNANAKQAKLNL